MYQTGWQAPHEHYKDLWGIDDNEHCPVGHLCDKEELCCGTGARGAKLQRKVLGSCISFVRLQLGAVPYDMRVFSDRGKREVEKCFLGRFSLTTAVRAPPR